jgi:LAO/AO transport system kinase
MRLADKVLEGDVQAVARLITGIEDEMPDALQELEVLYPYTGKAHVVGITGPPGIGKSTLIDKVVSVFRERNMTIGVVAIDPTSPFTGGALLGDRIRMQQRAFDPGVFIRSLATRGWLGGLAKAAMGAIKVIDAMGKDIILIETVGTGQSEGEMVCVVDTAIVVLSAETGDEIQIMKAGLMEIADIFVINKADKGGAENKQADIELMLNMKSSFRSEWRPSIILTEAISGKGVEDVVNEIYKHREFLNKNDRLEKYRQERAEQELIMEIESIVRKYFYQEIENGGYIEKVINDFVNRKEGPLSSASKIIEQFTKQFKAVTNQGN